MSNQQLIIEERGSDIGGFIVGRLLPFRRKRMVGPFIFIDHMGPAEIKPGQELDIGQHPHIGLCTLTYLLEGEIMHEDSTGSHQLISPGSVNLMTAGRGVVHTERSPKKNDTEENYRIHGYQIWIALPKDKEDIAPSFCHIPATELPTWSESGLDYVLVAGTAFGRQSPVPVYSPLFMLQIQSQTASNIDIGQQLFGEIGICIVKGYIELAGGERIEQGNMLVAEHHLQCGFRIGEESFLIIFGGQAFEEERHIYWNFVSSDPNKIEQAKKDWIEKRFPMIEGDESYIPLP